MVGVLEVELCTNHVSGLTTRLTSHLYTNGNGNANGCNLNGGLQRNGNGNGNGGHNSSEGEHDESSPEDEETYSDIELDTSSLTPEMSAKIADAQNILQNLHTRAAMTSSDKALYPREVAAQVNRVLEEEGITRCALAKFVLNCSYKLVYDALHDAREWTTLNAAGRDKYRKLKMWAENARCINAVKVLQVYCKDRRRRSEGGGSNGTENGDIAYKNGPYSISALMGKGAADAQKARTREEPTDLSLPKGQLMPMHGHRRKAFIPQRESLLGKQLSSSQIAMDIHLFSFSYRLRVVRYGRADVLAVRQDGQSALPCCRRRCFLHSTSSSHGVTTFATQSQLWTGTLSVSQTILTFLSIITV